MELFRPADILIPCVSDMTAWSVVACDQFTAEHEYWQQVYELVGDKPSSLRMILPEAELGKKDPAEESEKINTTMRKYLEDGIFSEYKDSFIYLERTLQSGVVRKGLIGMVDLEAYDWKEGTHTPVRATEYTVEDRLPPRVTVRRSALLEMPHIMIFMDDPNDSVFSSVRAGAVVYDFELMQNGGHVTGSLVSDNSAVSEALSQLESKSALFAKYGKSDDPVILAMGDGNHSIAAAKMYWDELKAPLSESERKTHPARFALAELVNIHDEAIVFEPIHKVLFNTDPKHFTERAREHFSAYSTGGRSITLVTEGKTERIAVPDMSLGELIDQCEKFCVAYIKEFGGRIDYIHGDEECISMSRRSDGAGILLPKMEKSELFGSVMSSGPFPKKSFSIGHAADKRYYLECRKIT